MNKIELQNEIDSIDLELRSLMDDVKDETKSVNVEEIRAKKADLEKRRADYVKQMAQADAPVVAEKRSSMYADIISALKEKRTVTVSGTGIINTVRELVKTIQKDDAILSRMRYFYGENANTVIPVWASNVTAAFISEGGSADADNAELGNSTIVPKEAFASLAISDMALDLSAVDIEAELNEIFANAFSALMAEKALTGASNGDMPGIFTASATAYTEAISVVGLAGLALKLKEKKYRNPCIVMSSTIYNAIMADTATDETTKIYKEDLIRNKMIEDIPVVLSPYAPTARSAGSKIAIGGDLANYAIGVAGALKIKPKETAGNSKVTFDAYMYFSGKPVIAGDFYAYTVATPST